MKRLVATFAAVIVCLSALAQAPIVGSWTSTDKESESASEDGVDADSQLVLTPDKKAKPKVEVKSDGFPAILKVLLINPLKSDLKKAIKETEYYSVISVSDKQLVLKDMDAPGTKKPSKPEDLKTQTYTRVL